MGKLDNKIIIVTGGNGLLGKAIVQKIKTENGICINADISNNDSQDLTEVHCDVTSENSIEQTIKKIIAKYGRIDGLVNNAYPRTNDWGKKLQDIPFESWQKNIAMQLNSVFIFCQQLLPVLQQQQYGSIVNMASIYGVVGPDFSVYNNTEMTMPAAYSAIKGGIINFTRYLAAYYGPEGIRINCVSPGGIFDNQDKKFVQQYESKVPLRKMGTPGDIAPSVTFLLSDEAAYITGHNLMVDGGWTAI